jgi:hypothetical protein
VGEEHWVGGLTVTVKQNWLPLIGSSVLLQVGAVWHRLYHRPLPACEEGTDCMWVNNKCSIRCFLLQLTL